MKYLSALEDQALGQFRKELQNHFGPRLTLLKLFGSKSRGDAHEESDLDILVLINDLKWEEKNWVIDTATNLLMKWDVFLSPLCMTPEEFYHLLNRERRIALDIEKEGIPF